jgi:hypothetical protein
MRIIGRGQERDPEHGKRMPDKKASRVLTHSSKGGKVDPDTKAAAVKAAKDHYAALADEAEREKD